MNRIELLCNQLTFQRLMRARVYIGMVTSIMLYATASSIILSSRRNGTGDVREGPLTFTGLTTSTVAMFVVRVLVINFKS